MIDPQTVHINALTVNFVNSRSVNLTLTLNKYNPQSGALPIFK
jgi:hypothetical protein